MSGKEYLKNHMPVPWHEYIISGPEVKTKDASLAEKSSIVGRIGMIMLSCGTTAWRIRKAMTNVSKILGITCTAEIGIVTINYTCYSGHDSYSQTITFDNIGVNTDRLTKIESLVDEYSDINASCCVEENHSRLDEIESAPSLYSPWKLALAAAFACAGFMFNLGGGLPEILCVFIAAGCGNLTRVLANRSKKASLIGVVSAALVSCIAYAILMLIARSIFPELVHYGSGYIGSVLFLVPGFPFITSILDFGKLDMRSGIERLVYSLIIMAFATIFCWAAALCFGLDPAVGSGIALPVYARILLRLIASFVSVIGFSMIFNSPVKMAVCAGVIGAVANTVRLELIDNTSVSAVICSFIGAFLVGLLAGFFVKKTGYPRVGITVPAVVVSVPGLFMYRSIYYIGTGDISLGIMFFLKAAAIVFAIGLGILFARYLTDPRFRAKD